MIGVRVIFGPEDEPTNDRADGCGGERAIPGRSRRVRLVEVDMGRPILVPKEIPVLLPAAEGDESADDAAHSENAAGHDPRPDSGPGSAVRRSLEAGGRRWTFTAVSMGNPHCVIFVDDPAEIDLGRFGPLIEHHPAFPRRINVEFVKVDPAGDLHVKVWERGAGVTLACGTGGCASLVAAVLEKRAGRKATVHLAGGPLQVEWRDDGRVMMTGPVQEVFRGHVSLFDFLG
ncbi:MAG: diaminopimelate epimerase [Firmicutes bacterium]|nr:diaminopimelate epimerase [Bacillota bacterium]